MKHLLRTTRSAEVLDTMFTTVRHFLPTYQTQYADPFCAIAEIPFELEIENCSLNDSNPHIINFYRWVKSGDFLKDGWLINQNTNYNTWSRNKNRFNRLISKGKTNTVEAAQLTFYLQHITTFFSFDSTGTFIGTHDSHGELPEIDWEAATALMQNWELNNHDDYTNFVVPEHATLVMSPPTIYTRQWTGFSWDKSAHTDLLHWANSHSGKVLVFHRRSRTIQGLYADWTEGDRVFQLV